MRRINIDELKERLKNKNPFIEFIGDEVNGVNHKVKFRCVKCGRVFYTSFFLILKSTRTNGCIKCEKRKTIHRQYRKKHDDFVKEVQEIHGVNLSIIGEYTKGSDKIRTKCNICDHIWFPEAKGLLKGYGCPICGHEKNKQSTTKNIEWLRKKVFEEHGENISIISGDYVNLNSLFLVKCNSCGFEWHSTGRNIKHRGCPICNVSKGEKLIANTLKKMGIEFEQQVKIDEKSPFNGICSFDFKIGDNIYIEYDGIQHYKSFPCWGGEKRLNRQKELDSFKDLYCLEKNYKLIRIPYWEYNEINEEYLKNKIYG